ncbi:MAG: hypothetical protein D6715_07020 [Calditrichaeota bacterium]|nr:MAG: hypothetical protein D6715_07020 [Calditrichota bacterium]
MKNWLHTLHSISAGAYFLAVILQAWLAMVLPIHRELVAFAMGWFYVCAIPVFILLFLSGILLTVWENYYFKQEAWLKIKAVCSLLFMALIILFESPFIRHLSLLNEASESVSSVPFALRLWLLASLIQAAGLIYLVALSFRHRKPAAG